jgi:pyruvate,water dikinase
MSTPRPAEDPNWIDEQLDRITGSPVDVETLLKNQEERHEVALQNLKRKTPKQFEALEQRLLEAARLTRLREAGRSEGVRTFWVARAFGLRAGELSGLGEAIFYLESKEIIRLLSGDQGPEARIPVRKAAYERYCAMPQYPTIIMGAFDPFEWASDPNRRADIFDATGRIGERLSSRIEGQPGSPGVVEGQVRVLDSPEEGIKLQPGEILVAVTTNIGWTPIFPRAAAVITDVGAPLSHAAIVARELGIPAVVGCFNATTVLKTGDRVRVDGAQGLVEILEARRKS